MKTSDVRPIKPIPCWVCREAFTTQRRFDAHLQTPQHQQAAARALDGVKRPTLSDAPAIPTDFARLQPRPVPGYPGLASAVDGFVFRLPLPHNLGNSRLHHMARDRMRRRYWEACDLAIGLLAQPRWGPFERARIRIDLLLPRRGRPMDAANWDSRCKWAIDWLVARRWIVDDSAKIIGKPLVEGRRCTANEQPALILTLTPEPIPA